MKRGRSVAKSSKCANPLFEKWLDEWRVEAVNRNSELQHSFARALCSLRKYPIELNSGRECLILQNFGHNLCAKLDRKLAEHKRNLLDTGDGNGQIQNALPKSDDPDIKTLKHSKTAVKPDCPSKLTSNDFVLNGDGVRDEHPPSRNNQSSPVNEFESKTNYEQLVFVPGQFEIILLIDTQENSSKVINFWSKDTVNNLLDSKPKYEVRHLNLGDFAWIARNDRNEELMLPYIVERKRMDDLACSIKDGRFHEQKFRLRQCGIRNVIYMVENSGKETARYSLPLSTLHQAAVNTHIVDEFFVKFTNDLKHSMTYLAILTNLLTKIFAKKTLISCLKDNLPSFSIDDDIISLLTYEEFSQFSIKNKSLKPREMFIKHLLQLNGVSFDKAFAIAQRYPSPRHLIAAFKSSQKPELLLSTIPHGSLQRNIGPRISKIIYKLYTSLELK